MVHGRQLPKKKDSELVRSEFRDAAVLVSQLSRRDGIPIVPFRDERLPIFSALPADDQEYALWMVKTLLQVIQAMQAQGEPLNMSKRLLWHFLKLEKLVAPSDLFENITNEDCVDVYSTSHRMMFANLRFFELFNYSLEDLYCRPWNELFERDNGDVHVRLMEVCDRLAKGEYRGVVDTSTVGEHVAFEALNVKKNAVHATPKVMAPLFARQKVEAYVCVNGAHREGDKPKAMSS